MARTLTRSLAALATGGLLVGPLAGAAQAAPKKPAAPAIVTKPPALTSVRSATFEFTHATAGVTFECSLDAAAFAACASPATYAGPLAEGLRTFKVRARDAAGTVSNAATATWTIDVTSPAAPSLTGVPATSPTGATTASLSFAVAEAGVTYVCALDGAAAAACTSPVELTGLRDGAHTFSVAARDSVGNEGAPATGTWTVDTTPPPAPSVTTGPASLTNATTATFAVFSPEAGAALTCALDGAAFAACPEPLTYESLGEGEHSFVVRAEDTLGNAAAAPAFTWTVDLTAPAPPAIVTGPAAQTKDAAAAFAFDGVDAATLRCSLDGGDYADCPAAFTTPALADGAHTLHVVGIDAAGNASGATPYAWSVDNTPPPAPVLTGPAPLSTSASATFGITSTESPVAFTCALDGAAAAACDSGVTYASLAEGAHTLAVTASDALGNGATATHTWTVDTVAPDASFATPLTVTAAVPIAFTEPVRGVGAGSVTLRVSGSTTPVAAALGCANAAGAAVSCADGPVSSVSVAPPASWVPGEPYTLLLNPEGAATIADPAGNALAAETYAFRPATDLQETAGKYTWRVVGTGSAYGGSYRTEHLAGSAATYAFNGTGIVWYTVAGKSQGLADVYVDGVKKATVNNYAASATYRVPRSISGLPAGDHVLRIVVRGVKGSRYGTGTSVAVDGFKVPGKTVASSPSIGQAWRTSPAAAAAGGAHAVADLAGQETTFRFRGTGISWVTSTGPNRGIAKVYVDGVLKATVDNYSAATAFGVARTITGLTDARHTVRVVVTGTKRAAAKGTFVTVDRWLVR